MVQMALLTCPSCNPFHGHSCLWLLRFASQIFQYTTNLKFVVYRQNLFQYSLVISQTLNEFANMFFLKNRPMTIHIEKIGRAHV